MQRIENITEYLVACGYSMGEACDLSKKAKDAYLHPTKGWRGPALGIGAKRAFLDYRLQTHPSIGE